MTSSHDSLLLSGKASSLSELVPVDYCDIPFEFSPFDGIAALMLLSLHI